MLVTCTVASSQRTSLSFQKMYVGCCAATLNSSQPKINACRSIARTSDLANSRTSHGSAALRFLKGKGRRPVDAGVIAERRIGDAHIIPHVHERVRQHRLARGGQKVLANRCYPAAHHDHCRVEDIGE